MHGLTRSSADFANICAVLHDDYRLIAVDQRGRRLSEYGPDPADYNAHVYVRDMLTLLDHLGVDCVAVIGTSMGDVISMVLGATSP